MQSKDPFIGRYPASDHQDLIQVVGPGGAVASKPSICDLVQRIGLTPRFGISGRAREQSLLRHPQRKRLAVRWYCVGSAHRSAEWELRLVRRRLHKPSEFSVRHRPSRLSRRSKLAMYIHSSRCRSGREFSLLDIINAESGHNKYGSCCKSRRVVIPRRSRGRDLMALRWARLTPLRAGRWIAGLHPLGRMPL